ncbi:MAG: F0F1 ATP synthase subunit epsilon, partial [Balneolaceae bacterium]|nr:F0F1 ATP synthase subunit epsilon [Balneolaceae bacterium]
MAWNKMFLKIMVPEKIVLRESVHKVIAEARNGFFCLEPRHIDFTAALRPGILYYYIGEEEHVIAVDEGILVKCGEEVLVSVVEAVEGTGPDPLSGLERQVREKFRSKEAAETNVRIALKNLEADLL